MPKVVPDEDKIPEDKKVHLPVLKNTDDVKEIRLSGTAITEAGKLTKHKYFEFLNMDMDDYTDLSFTEEEAVKIRGHLGKMSTGHTAMVPMICSEKCPFKAGCVFYKMGKAPFLRQCHPPGTKVLTKEYGYVNIEDLDPEIHGLVSYARRKNLIRSGKSQKGYSFKVGSRDYFGNMCTFTTSSGKEYSSTEDHICVARFNEKAIGKFCVYLMRQGDRWRIGKSKILAPYGENNQFGHKAVMSFVNRARRERADAIWILEVYDTNTEATLGEDYYSCSLQTSKSLFNVENTHKTKWDGAYRWVTQEQIDKHFEKLKKPESFYRKKLQELNLSIDYPIWESDNLQKSCQNADEIKLTTRAAMFIRACNVLTDIMDMPVFSEEKKYLKDRTMAPVQWEPIKKTNSLYEGKVYSLEVEKHKTYFANGIATHNCLIEVNLIREWTTAYIEQYEVDPNNFTEVSMINELAEIEVYLWRLSQSLAKPENAELVHDNIVGISPEGHVLTNKQLSVLLQAKESLYNRKAKIIKLMVGDRQEKYKREAALKQRELDDPSSSMADLRARLERLNRDANKMSIQIAEKSGQIIDVPVEEKPKEVSAEDLIGSGD